jgi:hypothetical protein
MILCWSENGAFQGSAGLTLRGEITTIPKSFIQPMTQPAQQLLYWF